MAIDYGVPVEKYIEGLEFELANIAGKSADAQDRRQLVEAELSAARNQPSTIVEGALVEEPPAVTPEPVFTEVD